MSSRMLKQFKRFFFSGIQQAFRENTQNSMLLHEYSMLFTTNSTFLQIKHQYVRNIVCKDKE